MIDKNIMPRCFYRKDSCLMNTGGCCRGLSVTRFKGKTCPFYKDVRKMKIEDVLEYIDGVKNGFTQKYGGK